MSIKLGIVGAGGIGRTHLQAAKRAGVEVACVADVNGAAAAKLAANEGVARHTADPDEMFAMPDVAGVIIGVPNKFHKDVAITALKAGKDVLLEKPMAMSTAECRAVNEVQRQTKQLLQIGFVRRYMAATVAAKDFINAGKLGTIYHAKAAWYRRRGIPGLGGWFTTKALSGGGPLIDLGVHLIDNVLYLMGYPKVVRVSGKTFSHFGKRMKGYAYESMWAGPPRYDGVFDVEDAAQALIRFDTGATFELNVTWAANVPDDMPNAIWLMGDKAGLWYPHSADKLNLITEEQGRNVDMTVKLPQANGFDEQIRAFVRNIETREQPHASGSNGETVQRIIDAIYESSERDREVEV